MAIGGSCQFKAGDSHKLDGLLLGIQTDGKPLINCIAAWEAANERAQLSQYAARGRRGWTGKLAMGSGNFFWAKPAEVWPSEVEWVERIRISFFYLSSETRGGHAARDQSMRGAKRWSPVAISAHPIKVASSSTTSRGASMLPRNVQPDRNSQRSPAVTLPSTVPCTVTDLVFISPRMQAFFPTVSRPTDSIVPSTCPSMTSSVLNFTEPLIDTPLDKIARGRVLPFDGFKLSGRDDDSDSRISENMSINSTLSSG
jgi:hypothetical protein